MVLNASLSFFSGGGGVINTYLRQYTGINLCSVLDFQLIRTMAPVPDETNVLYPEAAIPSTPENLDIKRNQASRPIRNPLLNKDLVYRQDWVLKNVIIMIILHLLAINGLWFILTGKAMWQTVAFLLVYVSFTTTGVTGGAHRLWAHRTYKAKLPFRIWLMLGQTGALQNDIYTWVRDHRVHHKFTDTNADPHNSTRGFFFCHVGWLLMKKHPDVINKGKTIDMSDVEADPVVIWQRKYYTPLVLLLTFIMPTWVPMYYWGESFYVSFCVSLFRYVVSLNGTWLVNSAAHMWGYRPYDNSINPTENRFVSTIGFGEGWHNYHHTFPWDYKAAELGNYRMNLTTALLDFAAYIGQAYDLKTVSEEMVRKRAGRTGDGSRLDDKHSVVDDDKKENHHFHDNCVWGWGDKDMKDEERNSANITYLQKKI